MEIRDEQGRLARPVHRLLRQKFEPLPGKDALTHLHNRRRPSAFIGGCLAFSWLDSGSSPE
jgi:hypothetical protein